ncbi:MAG: hypothetical protein K2N36_07755 [Ruminiclostridium sp.]|nr:hypothetical protein [Ruminiclostridium sp.]
MKYKIVDENGEVRCELSISDKLFPKLLERLKHIQNPTDIARYTPTEITLLDQLQLLARQSADDPELSADNTQAMCQIVKTLKG